MFFCNICLPIKEVIIRKLFIEILVGEDIKATFKEKRPINHRFNEKVVTVNHMEKQQIKIFHKNFLHFKE